ncbi:tumor necrosis factor receptor superfamily member 23 isoform X2 [Centropristis striata]|uniref:tumor necrosis factor receptor superfamily member 23 isoform X2 n=1 Tax=Centropristis striata TaxID=184440 RepID=UPI0027E17B52|nr:tumor necrosis factor receptor superfamily member 23 isoform X2 [Centropristis striata]
MMATDSSKFPTWFIAFALVFLLVSAVPSRADVNTGSHPCVDGTYVNEGLSCCLCSAGQYLEDHCTADLQYGVCKKCGPNTYSSQPNKEKNCERCTSCTQISANLEVAESCTAAKNAKCQCQKEHYCSSGIEPCRICEPCKKCGAEGIKVDCTAKNNTVCNDPIEKGINAGTIAGSIIGVLLVIGLALFAFFCWKKKSGSRNLTNEDPEERKPINVPEWDLQPNLYAIAEAIGWADMCMVATCSKVPDTVISACERDNPHDTQQQTVELLKNWEERQGRQAPKKLIAILQTNGKQSKAEKVGDILSRPHTV